MDELVWEGDINGKGRLRELEKPIIQQSHCPQSDSAVSKRYLCPGKHARERRFGSRVQLGRGWRKARLCPRLIAINIAAVDRANWNMSELTNAR